MDAVELNDLAGLVGRETGVSDWLQITQDRVNKFADATGDHQWIHIDVERATREIGGPIAHGYLTLSLLPFLSAGMMPVKGVDPRDQLRLGQGAGSSTWSGSASGCACANS